MPRLLSIGDMIIAGNSDEGSAIVKTALFLPSCFRNEKSHLLGLFACDFHGIAPLIAVEIIEGG